MFFKFKNFDFDKNTIIDSAQPINYANEQRNLHSFNVREVYIFLGQNLKNNKNFTQYAINHKKAKAFALQKKTRLTQHEIEIFIDRDYTEWMFCMTETPASLKTPSGIIITPHILDLNKGMDIIPWCTYYKLFQ